MSDIIAHIVFDDNNVLKSIEIVGDQTDYKTDLKTIVESGEEKNFYIKISVKQCANASMDCFSLSNGNMYQLDFDDFDFSNHVPIDKLLTTSADSKSGTLMSAESKSVNGSPANSKSVKPNSNPSTEGANLNIHRFKQLIVNELNKILKNVPSKEVSIENVPSIKNVPSKEEKDIFLPKFKQLIVEELNKILKKEVTSEKKNILPQFKELILDELNKILKNVPSKEVSIKNVPSNVEELNKILPTIKSENLVVKNSTEKPAEKLIVQKNAIIDDKINYFIKTGAENKRKAEDKRKADADAQAKAKAELEKNNLINDKEIKYDTEYTTGVIRNKKNFDIKNEMVVLYRHNTEIDRGIIESFNNINLDIDITINNKSYKLITMSKAMNTDVFTYFDSLRFIKSEAMQVPQDYIDSDFDNLKKMENNWGGFEQKMQFYSDIELNNKKKLDERHKTKRGLISSHEPIQGVPIYVDKNEWKKYIIKKDKKAAADAAVKAAEKAAAVKAAEAENKKKADEEAENKKKEAEDAENKKKEAEDAKYEKITNKINYNDGINYYFKDENGKYILQNGKILTVDGNLIAKLNLKGNPSIKCSNCYIKKDEKAAADAKQKQKENYAKQGVKSKAEVEENKKKAAAVKAAAVKAAAVKAAAENKKKDENIVLTVNPMQKNS